MNNKALIDLTHCHPVNHLWPRLVSTLGVDKASQAVRQAKDLQLMHGDPKTIPVLIQETCGVALVNIDSVKLQTGYSLAFEGMVLLISTKEKSLQLLKES